MNFKEKYLFLFTGKRKRQSPSHVGRRLEKLRCGQRSLWDDVDDENSNNLSTQNSNKSNESPLVSLEKMLAYSTTIQQPLVHHGIKKKQFDKYRLFAEKMLRSTFS